MLEKEDVLTNQPLQIIKKRGVTAFYNKFYIISVQPAFAPLKDCKGQARQTEEQNVC